MQHSVRFAATNGAALLRPVFDQTRIRRLLVPLKILATKANLDGNGM